jgi:hypothetical protein
MESLFGWVVHFDVRVIEVRRSAAGRWFGSRALGAASHSAGNRAGTSSPVAHVSRSGGRARDSKPKRNVFVPGALPRVPASVGAPTWNSHVPHAAAGHDSF